MHTNTNKSQPNVHSFRESFGQKSLKIFNKQTYFLEIKHNIHSHEKHKHTHAKPKKFL